METIGGHGRWSSDEGPKFLSNLALIHKSCPMGGGGVVEVVEVVEVYLQNQYTKTQNSMSGEFSLFCKMFSPEYSSCRLNNA